MKLDKKALMGDIVSTPLIEADPEIYDLVASERSRQQRGLNLVASENIAPAPVLQTLSSCLSNKYCEGLPKPRDLGSNKYLDRIEHMCQERALQAFNLPPAEWGVNVQPYSGTPANAVVYMALLNPHDRIMYLDVLDGGHLSHGHMTLEQRIAGSSIYFETMPYNVDPRTGLIDYNGLAKTARMFKPKLIIAGSASYSRCLNYKKFRQIADEVGAYLMADAGQVAGLVQAGVIPSPFQHCDVVSIATHHTLRGPRAGIIFFRKGIKSVSNNGDIVQYELARRLGQGVFPGPEQGPGLMLAGRADQIASIAYALRQARTPQFKEYQRQILRNAKALSSCLQRRGYRVVSGGTDTHLLLVDLRSQQISGENAEFLLERVNITCNRSAVPGDTSLERTSGIRLGTPTLTTRGLEEKNMEAVVDFIHRGLEIAREIEVLSRLRLEDFKRVVFEDKVVAKKVMVLRKEVEEFAEMFPFPSLHDL